MINEINISKNFKLREFACKGGSQEVKVHAELVAKLQLLRDRVGKAIVINSGYRTPEHNKRVGGVVDSYHVKGMAVDISIPSGWTVDRIAKLAKDIGFTGIGKYRTFVHLDVRPKLTEWDNR